MLTDLGNGLWFAAADVQFYGVAIQTRMAVIRLENGGLAVISPLVLDDALKQALAALGPVRHVMSPNKIHNQGIDSFVQAYPDASIWASPGLADRRPDIGFTGTLGDTPHADWADEMDQLTTQGNVFFSEVVFFHRASKTLIVADLVENISQETVKSAVARAAARAGHIFGRPLPSPEFRAYTDDPEAAGKRLDEIAKWPFETILLAHGDLITDRAHDVLRDVRDFLLAEVRARPDYKKILYRKVSTLQ